MGERASLKQIAAGETERLSVSRAETVGELGGRLQRAAGSVLEDVLIT